MTKKTAVTGMLALALVLLATVAGAAPTVTIASPANGATISRSASPTIDVTGTAAFDTPQPSQRKFYLNGNGGTHLSVVEGLDCNPGTIVSLTPVADETAQAKNYDATSGVPFTLDASRAITGVVSLISYPEGGGAGAGAGLTTVDISVSGDVIGEGNQLLGTTTVSYIATPLQGRYDTPWTIQPPTALDKKDFSSLRLSLTVRGRNLNHGWTRCNSTNVTIPIFTGGFSRAVQVAVDGMPFTSTGVTLSSDQTSYTATLSTPTYGSHMIRVRAVQGGSPSTAANSSITVTA
jgi:hypothetical protein